MLIPIHLVIFYIFTVILIASATMMITAKNPVKAILFLVVAFFASSVLWMLMQAEFLALVLIFVYVGAVMTLFLFVVMVLRTDLQPSKSFHAVRYYVVGFWILIIFIGTAWYVFSAKNWVSSQTLPTHYDHTYNNIVVMGTLLFTHDVLLFEICALLLLVGMISAIVLAFHGKKADTKSQVIREQLSVNKQERLKIIDLKNK